MAVPDTVLHFRQTVPPDQPADQRTYLVARRGSAMHSSVRFGLLEHRPSLRRGAVAVHSIAPLSTSGQLGLPAALPV